MLKKLSSYILCLYLAGFWIDGYASDVVAPSVSTKRSSAEFKKPIRSIKEWVKCNDIDDD